LRPWRGYSRLIADRSLLRGRPRPFPGGPLSTGPPVLYQPAVSGEGAALWACERDARRGPANEGDDRAGAFSRTAYCGSGAQGAALFEPSSGPAGSRPWGARVLWVPQSTQNKTTIPKKRIQTERKLEA
jgi:hypothetical protein